MAYDPDYEDKAVPTLGEANFDNIPAMTTSRCQLIGPTTMSHKWSLDLQSGLPDVEGLDREQVKYGFRLFFVNKHDEALKFFETYEDVYLFAMGKAAIMFVYSSMTLEDSDLVNTITYIKEVEVWVNAKVKEVTSSGWMPSVFSSQPLQSIEELHYRVMSAECTLLTACLQMLRESHMEKIKGALNIRSAFQQYKGIRNQAERRKKETGESIDAESQSSVHFGFGVFNMVVSLLPPRIMALVSFLGFPSDREFGLDELELSQKLNSVRSPLATGALLSHHVFLQGAFCHSELHYKVPAKRVLKLSLEHCPNGGIFLMFLGRQARLEKDSKLAIEHFKFAQKVQLNWQPLVHMCSYELAFTSMFLMDWETAIFHWDKLMVENKWSKGFYCYCKGVCQIANGDPGTAVETFKDISNLLGKSKKINGKPLPVDRYIKRKYDRYLKGSQVGLALPALELIYVWNGFPQMTEDLLIKRLEEVHQWRRDNTTIDADSDAVACLIEGAIHSQLKQDAKAVPLLERVEEIRKKIVSETWSIAYARYELAMMYWRVDHPEPDRASKKMKHAMAKKGDFNFDLQLDLRGHLALYQFKRQSANAGKQDDSASHGTHRRHSLKKKKKKRDGHKN